MRNGLPRWTSFAYCATREGLLLQLKTHLVEDRLTELGCYKPRQEKAFSTKHGRVVIKSRVTSEMLAVTTETRARMAANDLAYFNVDMSAWAIVQALPEYFPKPKEDLK
jgi:hypothetical protein